MKLAVTIWGNRISPVFDAAGTLLIAEVQDGTIVNKTYKPFRPEPAADMIDMLKQAGVSTLICGAISTGPADLITEHGICLVPFITGNALAVLDTYVTRKVIDSKYVMPGCPSPFV